MNELKQMRERLMELDEIWRHGASMDGQKISIWGSKHWLELDNIVEVLNLLDPCWADELDINEDWVLFAEKGLFITRWPPAGSISIVASGRQVGKTQFQFMDYR